MRRYLTISEVSAALSRGKQVEQFLGGFLAGGVPAVRYVVLRKRNERIIANIYECYEPEYEGHYDVVEFASVDPDDDSEDFYFDSLEDAVEFMKYRNGASEDRYVNQGLIQEEYSDYQKNKRA